MVWIVPGPVSGILVMAPYPTTRSDMCTRDFATSVSVSDKAQKKLGEFTHHISSTRLM